MAEVASGLQEFLGWVSQAEIPVRNEQGELVVWDQEKQGFSPVTDANQTSFYIGEVGSANVSIRSNVTMIKQVLTVNDLSRVEAEIADPGLAMLKNGYFVLDRTINFNGIFYKITDVTTHWKFDREIVAIVGKSFNGVRMMADKGSANFGTMSPTSFAQAKAAEFGMGFVGEPSLHGEVILRRQDDETDESTWDVLKRLAGEQDFNLFESNNVLYFASDEWIIDNTDSMTWKVPAEERANEQVISVDVRQSSSRRYNAQCDVRFAKNNYSTSLLPGQVFQLSGTGSNDNFKFMIENVNFEAEKDSQVLVTSRTVEKSDSFGCSSQVFQKGYTGNCVRRIQSAVEAEVDGIYGPITEDKVKVFQRSRGITDTGIVGPVTWKAIESSS